MHVSLSRRIVQWRWYSVAKRVIAILLAKVSDCLFEAFGICKEIEI